MTQPDRRFIEETFPVKDVSQHAAREKNIRHGHISTLHIWWARRPLAASRATAFAALIPATQDILEGQKQSGFIVELCRWENSLNIPLLEHARRALYAAHAERLSAELGRPVSVDDIVAGHVPPPRVLDPFSGGGSYPLEALRLGCEAYANDYNPVAVLILKATLEYPQQYGHPFAGMPEHLWRKGKTHAPHAAEQMNDSTPTDAPPPNFNPLLEAVKEWGEWVLNEARTELAGFYAGPNGETAVGYIWARTLPCQNPACGVEIPLMRQFWLAKKDKKKIALHPFSHGPGQPIAFEIVAQNRPGYAPWPKDFDPERGTVKGAVVTCQACGAVIDANTTRRLFREGKAGQRLVAVVLSPRLQGGRGAGGEGKTYRLPTEADLATYRAAEQALQAKRERLRAAWGMEPLPDEPLPPRGTLGINVRGYGVSTWSDLFNPRQALALLTFADAVRRAHAEMLAQGYPEDFARAVAIYLGIIFNRLADKNAKVVVYNVVGEKIEHVFGRQVLPMVWDYVEVNPFTDVGWPNMFDWVVSVLDHLTRIPATPGGDRTRIGADTTDERGDIRANPSHPWESVSHASATRLPYPDAFFDAVLTDPPYYDNVPYSHLSDFFYVWLKRTVGHLYPDLFITPLTPKSGEIVAYSQGEGGSEAGKRFFEEQLAAAFREIARVLKPGGVAVVVYAHKSTAGWETVINALLDSGLVVSAAWPLNTEMQSRLNANETASLASSIYIVARKAPRQGLGFYHEVRAELRRHLDKRLQRLWEEGISGADFFIAAIGSAIEVFGKYEQVIDLEGNVIRGRALLDEVRSLVTDFAVRQILHEGGQPASPYSAEISDRVRFYVLWRWNYGEARIPFDEARKLAQSCGLDLIEEWSRRGGVVKKEQEFVCLLGPHQREMEHLAAGHELIDVLHHVLRLWEKGDRAALIQRLAESGYGRSEAFYRVAQAISQCLPNESKEKKLLDGLLTSRSRLREESGEWH
jgi:adenine-specific DNA methylase